MLFVEGDWSEVLGMLRCRGVCWCNCVVMDVVLHVDGLMSVLQIGLSDK